MTPLNSSVWVCYLCRPLSSISNNKNKTNNNNTIIKFSAHIFSHTHTHTQQAYTIDFGCCVCCINTRASVAQTYLHSYFLIWALWKLNCLWRTCFNKKQYQYGRLEDLRFALMLETFSICIFFLCRSEGTRRTRKYRNLQTIQIFCYKEGEEEKGVRETKKNDPQTTNNKFWCRFVKRI